MRRFSPWLVLALVALPLVALALQDKDGVDYTATYPLPVRAGASSVVFRETANLINLGTAASPCLNAGTTASSATIPAGVYLLSVMSETVSVCMAPDANCDTGVPDLVPGTQRDIIVASANAGTWYCRSAGGTGYVTLRSP